MTTVHPYGLEICGSRRSLGVFDGVWDRRAWTSGGTAWVSGFVRRLSVTSTLRPLMWRSQRSGR